MFGPSITSHIASLPSAKKDGSDREYFCSVLLNLTLFRVNLNPSASGIYHRISEIRRISPSKTGVITV
ncbi:hypothetical protein L596_013055 [Steinernema carpocapsae]|uniref:Uncharacterized protein n=1 Tax=Steinernema carpocapsae TaxID=34508 RepID=A0A4U5NZI3_STECR|nr:hypothetical protein L596_013055 [Steinernema carpocapsae]